MQKKLRTIEKLIAKAKAGSDEQRALKAAYRAMKRHEPRCEHEQTHYYDNEPVVTMHSMSDYILLCAVNDDIKTRVLLTPKQAKIIGKQLKKLAKRMKGK